jgi:hypothetical protein
MYLEQAIQQRARKELNDVLTSYDSDDEDGAGSKTGHRRQVGLATGTVATTTREIAKKNQAVQALRAVYLFKDQMMAEDRSVFRETAETHIAEFASSMSLRNWLTIQVPRIKASVLQAKTLAIVGVRPQIYS